MLRKLMTEFFHSKKQEVLEAKLQQELQTHQQQASEIIKDIIMGDPELYQQCVKIGSAALQQQSDAIADVSIVEDKAHKTGLRNRKHHIDVSVKTTSRISPEIAEVSKTKDARKTKVKDSEPSFIKHIIATMFPSIVSSVLPLPAGILGLLAMARVAAADFPKDLAVISGTGGGDDICSGVWCIQNSVKNLTSEKIVAAFTHDIGISAKPGTWFTELAISDCFDHDKLSDVVKQVIGNFPDSWQGHQDVSVDAGIWQGIGFHGRGRYLSTEAGEQLKSSYAIAANSCQTAAVQAEAFGIGLGMIVGPAVVLALCFGAYLYFRESGCDKIKKCIIPGYQTNDEKIAAVRAEYRHPQTLMVPEPEIVIPPIRKQGFFSQTNTVAAAAPEERVNSARDLRDVASNTEFNV